MQPFEQKRESCRREAEAARKEEAAAGAEAERLTDELREVRGAVAQRRAEGSAQRSQSAITQALMAARKDIPGIRGRLGTPCIFALVLPSLSGYRGFRSSTLDHNMLCMV